MDFVTDLPPCDGRTNLLVITDRLSKGVILELMAEITVEVVAEVFLYTFYRRHGIPVCIVSDRGTQFVSTMWTRICQLLGIVRRLSTVYYPQIDGSTEQKNQVVEAYIRAFVLYAQDDWTKLMPAAELALNNRDASSTGVSPFFLIHGYHVEPLVLPEEPQSVRSPQSPVQTADSIVRKLRSAVEWAQSAMAVSQQEQEEQANRLRTEGPRFKVGDKV
jgi:transposase InsO family protein